jgi:acyl-coenzyme A thioesterase 13
MLLRLPLRPLGSSSGRRGGTVRVRSASCGLLHGRRQYSSSGGGEGGEGGEGGGGESFIQKVSREGLDSMLGTFHSSGKFDSCLGGEAAMECVRIGDGEVECVLTVTESLSNTYGTMHGGAISTCIDVLGSMALLTKDHTRAGVSVDMNMTFCSAARVGETLSLTGSVLRYGKSMGFTNIVIARQRDGAVIATGRHTKAFPAYSNLQK